MYSYWVLYTYIWTEAYDIKLFIIILLFQFSNGHSSAANQWLEDKVDKLEADKDNLTLQVSVLSDQIEAQVEKIRDLERSLRLSYNNKAALNGHREGTVSRYYLL